MSDRHTISADYQIKQARKVKRLEAENSRLRAEVQRMKARYEPLPPIRHAELTTDAEGDSCG